MQSDSATPRTTPRQNVQQPQSTRSAVKMRAGIRCGVSQTKRSTPYRTRRPNWPNSRSAESFVVSARTEPVNCGICNSSDR